MADNIIAGKPDMYVARTSGAPESKGFDADNTGIIYAGGVNGYRSWRPGYLINSLTTLTAGEGILLDPLTSREDETNLIGGGFLPAAGVGFMGLVTIGSDIILADGGEFNSIMRDDGITVDYWYRYVGGLGIQWGMANNATLRNLVHQNVANVTGYFPTVIKVGSIYYMFLNPPDYVDTKNVFLYSSTNKFTWTILNGGATVIPTDPAITSWKWTLYNTGFCAVGDQFHILVEGTAGHGEGTQGPYSIKPFIGYATAPISNPVFTLTALPQIEGGGNVDLHYVPDRNALVALFGGITTYALGDWHCQAVIGHLDTDLTVPANWHRSTVDLSMFGALADPSFLLTPGKTYTSQIIYNRDQTNAHHTYLPTITSLNDLYDKLMQAE